MLISIVVVSLFIVVVWVEPLISMLYSIMRYREPLLLSELPLIVNEYIVSDGSTYMVSFFGVIPSSPLIII